MKKYRIGHWMATLMMALVFSAGFSCVATAAQPTAYWTFPGQLAWDSVENAEKYIVCLYNEAGERIGNNGTKKTEMEMYSFMGWDIGNESMELRVEVEARNSENKKIIVMDPGLTIDVNVSDKVLSYTIEPDGGKYILQIHDKIKKGDILLDTWKTHDDNSHPCHWTGFSNDENGYTSKLRDVRGDFQEVRLISDNNLENDKIWSLNLTKIPGEGSVTTPDKEVAETKPESKEPEKQETKPTVTTNPDSAEEIILKIGSTEVLVDGKAIKNDVAPIVKDGRTFLPIRVIAENMGANINWNGANQSLIITKEDTEITVFINKTEAKVNTKMVPLSAPAFIEKGRTYLPVRFVTENLGAEVIWDAPTKTVTIHP